MVPNNGNITRVKFPLPLSPLLPPRKRYIVRTTPRLQDNNGGALKLELGAVGVFKGKVDLADISILPADTGIVKFLKGAAIHSNVRVRVLCAVCTDYNRH